MEHYVENIREMEDILNASVEAVEELQKAFDKLRGLRSDMERLFDYYGSEDWFKDLERWDKGQLPNGLCCGVLSEDAVYDLLIDYTYAMKNIRTFCETETLLGKSEEQT